MRDEAVGYDTHSFPLPFPHYDLASVRFVLSEPPMSYLQPLVYVTTQFR